MGFPTEGNFIFRMEVTELIFPGKVDELSDWEDKFNEKDIKEKTYELFFPTFEEMSKRLKEIIKGCHQYWADVVWDLHGNNKESLEYHNGKGEWDKQYFIETSRIYLTADLLESIKKVNG